jgi:4-amino-4-deoxy-L-arabinose transferase-like glycosyltransferase
MRPFIVVLLLTFFLRIFQISSTPSGLYWDELDTGYQAYSLLLTGRDYFGNLFPAHLQSFADYRSGLYMYLTVPWVKIFGLSPFSVRLTAVFSSILILFILYYLARKFLKLPANIAWVVPAVWGLSPWVLVQGRIAAESMLMPLFLLTGFALLFITRPSTVSRCLSALFFAVTFWTYGTAKVFVPVFLILTAWFFWPKLVHFFTSKPDWRSLIPPLIIFSLVAFPVVKETLTRNISMRFSELSVFTDPVTVSEINFRRLESALGGGTIRTVGMQPGLMEKLVYNKFTYWSEKVIGNYLKAFSTDFLFTAGDPQLRHHIGLVNTGQFYPVELVVFLLGLSVLFTSRHNRRTKLFLIAWLVLSPIAAVLTRDGGNHAPRLLPLLPPMVFIISLGIAELFKHRPVAYLYLAVYGLCVFLAGFHFFTTYRTKSAAFFNTGFTPAAAYAQSQVNNFDRVILDGHNESLLMAYLFTSKFDPAVFQTSFPLPSETLTTGVEGYKFNNLYILYPGTRDWAKINLDKHNLIITASTQPNSGSLKALTSFLNPDGSTALVATVK